MSTEFFSLMIALIAIFVGPFISYKIAKRQLKAQIIDYSDLQDLKLLRDSILDLLKVYSDIAFLVNKKRYGGMTKEEFNKEHPPLFTSLLLMRDKISLLINVKDPKHLQLLDKVHKIAEVLFDDENKNWEENSIRFQGEITTLAIEIINYQKQKLEKKFL